MEKDGKKMSKFRWIFVKYILTFKIKKADRLSGVDNKKRLIVRAGNGFIIIKREDLKQRLKQNKSKITLQEFERTAIYKTYNDISYGTKPRIVKKTQHRN